MHVITRRIPLFAAVLLAMLSALGAPRARAAEVTDPLIEQIQNQQSALLDQIQAASDNAVATLNAMYGQPARTIKFQGNKFVKGMDALASRAEKSFSALSRTTAAALKAAKAPKTRVDAVKDALTTARNTVKNAALAAKQRIKDKTTAVLEGRIDATDPPQSGP